MKISQEAIRELFASNERRGANMRRAMLWGYFFKDSDPARLAPLRSALEAGGYQYVDVLGPEDGISWLHMSKVEQLTAEQLFERCRDHDGLARKHGVEFDGFDVGNVDGSILYPTESIPPVEDLESSHPVPSAWRSTLEQIVHALVGGDYSLSSGVASVAKLSKVDAKRIQANVSAYGETLVGLPQEAWSSSVAQWMETHWDVLVDLWTAESGRSDLVLFVRVWQKPGGTVKMQIDSVHVP